jgi:hypothetical protein
MFALGHTREGWEANTWWESFGTRNRAICRSYSGAAEPEGSTYPKSCSWSTQESRVSCHDMLRLTFTSFSTCSEVELGTVVNESKRSLSKSGAARKSVDLGRVVGVR